MTEADRLRAFARLLGERHRSPAASSMSSESRRFQNRFAM
jgi:hypothetical protein